MGIKIRSSKNLINIVSRYRGMKKHLEVREFRCRQLPFCRGSLWNSPLLGKGIDVRGIHIMQNQGVVGVIQFL